MKFNLKNRPKFRIIFPDGLNEQEQRFDDWFEGFEEDLREIKEIIEAKHYETDYGFGRLSIIKEILGEA